MADKVMAELERIAREMNSKALFVGFVDKATYPDGTSVVSVAVENEYGVPDRNQPARPFFRNAISSHSDEWLSLIERGFKVGQSWDSILEVAGATIAADVKASIIQLVDPPLSPYTIARRRNAKHRASVNKPVNTSVKPLEDTKKMLNDVTYEVRDNESS